MFCLHLKVDAKAGEVLAVLTTPWLLFNLVRSCRTDLIANQSVIGDDAYYKLFYNNSTKMLSRTTIDAGQHFHIVSHTITNNEREVDFVEVQTVTTQAAGYMALALASDMDVPLVAIPTTTTNGVMVYTPEFNIAVSDAADAIINAHKRLYPNIVVCHPHQVMKQKEYRKYFAGPGGGGKEKFNEWREDISEEHYLTVSAFLALARERFNEKWTASHPSLVATHQREWRGPKGKNALGDNKSGSTTSSCFYEKTHDLAKLRNDKKPQSVGAMTSPSGISDWLKDFSKLDKAKGFALHPDVHTFEQWRRAQRFLKLDPFRLRVQASISNSATPVQWRPCVGKIKLVLKLETFKAIPPGMDEKEFIKKAAPLFLKAACTKSFSELDDLLGKHGVGTTFQDVIDLSNQFNMLRKFVTPYGNTYWACSCSTFAEKAACHHSLALGIHSGDVDIPDKYNSKTVGNSKRKPGRPKNMLKALDKKGKMGERKRRKALAAAKVVAKVNSATVSAPAATRVKTKASSAASSRSNKVDPAAGGDGGSAAAAAAAAGAVLPSMTSVALHAHLTVVPRSLTVTFQRERDVSCTFGAGPLGLMIKHIPNIGVTITRIQPFAAEMTKRTLQFGDVLVRIGADIIPMATSSGDAVMRIGAAPRPLTLCFRRDLDFKQTWSAALAPRVPVTPPSPLVEAAYALAPAVAPVVAPALAPAPAGGHVAKELMPRRNQNILFKGLKVCATGVEHSAKESVKQAVEKGGGTFTEVVTKDTTHLVAIWLSDEKCDAAQALHMPIVSVEWVLQSAAAIELLPEDDFRIVLSKPHNANVIMSVQASPLASASASALVHDDCSDAPKMIEVSGAGRMDVNGSYSIEPGLFNGHYHYVNDCEGGKRIIIAVDEWGTEDT